MLVKCSLIKPVTVFESHGMILIEKISIFSCPDSSKNKKAIYLIYTPLLIESENIKTEIKVKFGVVKKHIAELRMLKVGE